MKLPVKARARVEEAFARRITGQVDDLRGEVRRLHDDLRGQVDHLHSRLDDLAGRDGELEKRISDLEHRIDPVERESSWTANELARLAPQAAAFEARLEQRTRPQVLTGELADLPEARTLVEVVREEHARVRARLALVSSYEERLRRLEQRSQDRPGS